MADTRAIIVLLLLPALIAMAGCHGESSQAQIESSLGIVALAEPISIPEKPVSAGMTRAEVLEILGPPKETEKATIRPARCDFFEIRDVGSERHLIVFYLDEVAKRVVWTSPEGCYLTIE
ncbi:hypothetical protein [Ruegeria atlantica]|uniref:hypothetical protein n=1 Tax=Ruegeria atlantica TaxID=81569 RepID=UPI00147E9394|nr:hypothetical protein [Ruegeria atlantica]